MPRYLTPGVYLSPQLEERRDIQLVRTDVPGFVGFAERGPLVPERRPDNDDPASYALRITSWAEYRAYFGGFIPHGFLPWAVRAFFENGGTTCYVLRVAATTAFDTTKRPRAAELTIAAARRAAIRLTADAAAGATRFTVDDTAAVLRGDLLDVVTDGVVEMLTVRAVIDATTLDLGTPAARDHRNGDYVAVLTPGFTLAATSAGSWGDRVHVRVTPLETAGAKTFFALRLTASPPLGETRPEEEIYTRLSIGDRNAPDYAPKILEGSHLVRMTFGATAEPALLFDGGPLADPYARLRGGRDGIAAATVRDFAGALDDPRGLRLLEEIDEIKMIAVPDAVYRLLPTPPPPPKPPVDPCASAPPPEPPLPLPEEPRIDDTAMRRIHALMIEQCARLRYRVAIIDPLDGRQPAQIEKEIASLRTRDAKFAAIYYPWVEVPDLTRTGEAVNKRVAPSGHIAGVYARNDHVEGVQHAPANYDLEFVSDVGLEVSDRQQESLNETGVNAIRMFPGRGIRVWGARSLSTESAWKFIHVRRLLSYIEESIEKSAQWTVFRTNDEDLRRTLVHSLNVFLEGIWATGGLKGATPAEGFYVKCDETNNPPALVDTGLLVCEIGVAIAAPMEFIVFELRQSVTGSQVAEVQS